MKLVTTTIGSYPKPSCTPIEDWFLSKKLEEERLAFPQILPNWMPGEYEAAIRKNADNIEDLFKAATKEVILDQVAAGIDVPTDGEVRRENYIFYQCRLMNGISFSEITKKTIGDGVFESELPTVVGSIALSTPRLKDEWKLSQSFTRRPVKVTLPGPLTIADFVANEFYSDKKILGVDLGEALNTEIRALAESGCPYIQIDEPVFGRKPGDALEYGLDNVERVFHGIPKEIKRVLHVCCGYPNALDSDKLHKADKDFYVQIADAIEQSSINEISIEDAHHNNDLSVLEIFVNTSVILGVIDVARSRLETIEEIRDRLKAALEHIDQDRLIVAPDCGLGFFSRSQAIQKLSVMSEAAKSI